MIYCKPIPDEEIFLQLENSEHVLLLGCSLCANISYCIENNIEKPMYNWILNPKAVEQKGAKIYVRKDKLYINNKKYKE